MTFCFELVVNIIFFSCHMIGYVLNNVVDLRVNTCVIYFRLNQIQEAAARHLGKFRISLEWVIRSTFMN